MDGVMHPSVEQAIGRDRIRKAFKRYENNPADEHDRGIVRAVNSDGSYEVLLDGDVQTARCAPYAKAMVGDRVIVVTTKDGENVLLGRLGGEIGGGDGGSSEDNSWYVNPADYVVEWGNTDGWRWEKWASGKAYCEKTIEVEVTGWIAGGSLYYTNEDVNPVSFPFEFAEAPRDWFEINKGPATAFLVKRDNYGATTTQSGTRYIARGSSTDASGTFKIAVKASGFWKTPSEAGGTESIAPTIAERFERLETDYIVAEGTSGIWTWRKWASGEAECWGKQTFNPTGAAWLNHYIADTIVTLPFGFTTFENALISVTAGGSNVVYGNIAVISGTTLRYYHASMNDVLHGTSNIYIKGRWK